MRASLLAVAAALLAAVGPAAACAASVSVVRSTVTFEALPGEANDVTVLRTPRVVRVLDAGATALPGAGCRSRGANAVECDAAGVRRIVVLAGDGDDEVVTSVGTETVIRGGDGDDLLEGGEGPDMLDGGRGDDVLLGGNGPDVLDGGPGADDLSGGREDADVLDLDSVTYPRTGPVRVTVDGVADDGEPGEGDNVRPDVEAVLGGRGDDVLVGNGETMNALFGGGGNDRLLGLGGEIDLLFGERGDDVLVGGAGTDLVAGGWGDDRVDAGAGADLVDGARGDDTLFGGPGGDALVGGAGRDRVAAGSGDDKIAVRDGTRDVVGGGPGSDSAVFDRGLDVVRGVESLGRGRTRPAPLTGRLAQRRSLFDSMSNHMAKSRSWSPEMTSRATRTMVAAGMSFPAMRSAVSTTPRTTPTAKRPSPSP